MDNEPIEVRITRKDLVVLSYPGPDRSVRLADLQAGRAISRRYRNRRIGEFLKELDITEGRSTGIPRILHTMEANGSPPPEFEFNDDHSYFMCRLPVHTQATMPEGLIDESGKASAEKLGKRLGKNQSIILELLLQTPDSTIPEIAATIGISTTAVENNIKKLKEIGALKRIGSSRGGHWEVQS